MARTPSVPAPRPRRHPTKPAEQPPRLRPPLPEFVRHRLFRDWLTATPDDRRLYEHAKRLAAEQSNDAGETTMDYNARKQSVIRDIYHRLFAASGLL